MGFLEKNCNKKTVGVLGVLGGGLPLLILLLFGVLKVFSLGFMYASIFYTASLSLGIGVFICGYSIYKKNKAKELYIYLALLVVSFIFLLQYKDLIDLLSGSYVGLLSLALSYYDGGIFGSFGFWFAGIIWTGLVGYSVMIYTSKISLGFDNEEPVEEIDMDKVKQSINDFKENDIVIGKKASENIKETSSKVKEYIETKNGKRNVAIISVLIVAIALLSAYFTIFDKTTIDITSNLEVSFNGQNGKGYIVVENNDIEYDQNDSNMYYFVNGLTYSYSPKSGKLSNGDEVTVSVGYSKEDVKKLKLDIKNDTKKFKVEGLIERYDNASKVDKKIANELKKEAEEKANNIGSYLTDFTEIKTEYVDSYFGKVDKLYNSDCYLAVYKVTAKEKQYSSEEVKDVIYYYALTTSEVDSTYDGNKKWQFNKLKGNDYKAIVEESKIEEGLYNLYFAVETYTKFE